MFTVSNIKTKQVVPAILTAYPVYNCFLRGDYKNAALLAAPALLAIISPGLSAPGGAKASDITSLITNVSLAEGAGVAAAAYGTYNLYNAGYKGEAMLAALATLCTLFLGAASDTKAPFALPA